MAYTAEQVKSINAAREANVKAGRPAASGAGATALSSSKGGNSSSSSSGSSSSSPLVPGTPEYQAKLSELMATAQGIKASADKLAAEQASRDAGVVSSSTSVRQGENQTKLDVQNLTKGFNEEAERTKLTGSSSLSYLDNYWQMLERRRAEEVEGINKSFNETKRQTGEAQKREVGSTSASLARIGGYLGGSASGTGAMLNLAETHKNEVLKLESQRATAIREANTAITDKQFQVAKLKVEEAREIEKEVERRKQQFFDNNLKILQEERQQDKALREKYKEELETMAILGSSDEGLELDPNKAREIDEFYGVPGFTKQYLEVTSAAAKAKSQKEVIEANQKMVSLLKDIPAGQTIKFPDGTEYTGIGSAGDIATFQETDADGVVRMFTYNKMTGALSSQSLGLVGKPQSSDGSSSSPRVQAAEEALSSLVDPKTKFVPVPAYVDMYRAYIKENKGKGPEFLTAFDPLLWTGKSIDGTKLLSTPPDESEEEDSTE